MVADVDLTGDDTETHLAVRLRALEAQIRQSPAVVDCTLSLSAPDEPSLVALMRVEWPDGRARLPVALATFPGAQSAHSPNSSSSWLMSV